MNERKETNYSNVQGKSAGIEERLRKRRIRKTPLSKHEGRRLFLRSLGVGAGIFSLLGGARLWRERTKPPAPTTREEMIARNTETEAKLQEIRRQIQRLISTTILEKKSTIPMDEFISLYAQYIEALVSNGRTPYPLQDLHISFTHSQYRSSTYFTPVAKGDLSGNYFSLSSRVDSFKESIMFAPHLKSKDVDLFAVTMSRPPLDAFLSNLSLSEEFAVDQDTKKLMTLAVARLISPPSLGEQYVSKADIEKVVNELKSLYITSFIPKLMTLYSVDKNGIFFEVGIGYYDPHSMRRLLAYSSGYYDVKAQNGQLTILGKTESSGVKYIGDDEVSLVTREVAYRDSSINQAFYHPVVSELMKHIGLDEVIKANGTERMSVFPE